MKMGIVVLRLRLSLSPVDGVNIVVVMVCVIAFQLYKDLQNSLKKGLYTTEYI